MLAAALAIGDRETALGKLVTIGVLKSLPLAMNGVYYPDGCYPEGPQYWAVISIYICCRCCFYN